MKLFYGTSDYIIVMYLFDTNFIWPVFYVLRNDPAVNLIVGNKYDYLVNSVVYDDD